MASNTVFREMPNKPLPISLLIDLRRRGIRVPREIQMRIMMYKERIEMEEMKEAVLEEIGELVLCPHWQFPILCGQKEWKSFYQRPLNPRKPIPDPFCHWCLSLFCNR